MRFVLVHNLSFRFRFCLFLVNHTDLVRCKSFSSFFSGIHLNASNGKYAYFQSNECILSRLRGDTEISVKCNTAKDVALNLIDGCVTKMVIAYGCQIGEAREGNETQLEGKEQQGNSFGTFIQALQQDTCKCIEIRMEGNNNMSVSNEEFIHSEIVQQSKYSLNTILYRVNQEKRIEKNPGVVGENRDQMNNQLNQQSVQEDAVCGWEDNAIENTQTWFHNVRNTATTSSHTLVRPTTTPRAPTVPLLSLPPPKQTKQARKDLIFVHLRKCGGTSVVRALKKVARRSSSIHFPTFHRNGNAWENNQLVRYWLPDEGLPTQFTNINLNDDDHISFPSSLSSSSASSASSASSFSSSSTARFEAVEGKKTAPKTNTTPSTSSALTTTTKYNFHTWEWGGFSKQFKHCQTLSNCEMLIMLREPWSRFLSEFFFYPDEDKARFYFSTGSTGTQNASSSNASASVPSLLPLTKEVMSNMPFTTWTALHLYWSRDTGIPFRVSINKPNYYVRMLNGLSNSPNVLLNVTHLNEAKRILCLIGNVMVLEDPSTYELLRKYGCKPDEEESSTLLPKANASNTKNRNMKRIDVKRSQWESINVYDCELYAWWNIEQQKNKMRTTTATTTAITTTTTAATATTTTTTTLHFWDDASFSKRWNYRYRPAFIFNALRERGYQAARTEQERKHALKVEEVFGVARIFHKTKQMKVVQPVPGILHVPRSVFNVQKLCDKDFEHYGWFVKGSPSCGGKDVIYCTTLAMLHSVYNEMMGIIGIDEIVCSQHVPVPRTWNHKKTDLRIFGYVDSRNNLYIQTHAGIRTCSQEWHPHSIELDVQLTNTSREGTMCSTKDHWPWEHLHSWENCRNELVVPLVREYWEQTHTFYPMRPQTLSFDMMLSDEDGPNKPPKMYFIEVNANGISKPSGYLHKLKLSTCRDLVEIEHQWRIDNNEKQQREFSSSSIPTPIPSSGGYINIQWSTQTNELSSPAQNTTSIAFCNTLPVPPSSSWIQSIQPLPETVPMTLEEELCHLNAIDIVIPIKQEAYTLRSVLASVHEFYHPRTIYLVAPNSVLNTVERLMTDWEELKTCTIVLIDEHDFFFKSHGFDRTNLEIHFNAMLHNRTTTTHTTHTTHTTTTSEGIKDREFGWWYQQLIKLGAGQCIPGLSPIFVVWDADLIPVKRWPLLVWKNKLKQTALPIVAVLQQKSKRKDIYYQYGMALNDLFRSSSSMAVPYQPTDVNNNSSDNGSSSGGEGTFITHHMVFDQQVLDNMLQSITTANSSISWPIQILNLILKYNRFSEYLTYSSYALQREKLSYHKYSAFGKHGVRVRGGGGTIMHQLMALQNTQTSTGIKRSDILQWCHESSNHEMSYVQLDHCYQNLSKIGMKMKLATPLVHQRLDTQRPHHNGEWTYLNHYCTKRDDAKNQKICLRGKHWWDVFTRIGAIFIHVPKNAGTTIEFILENRFKNTNDEAGNEKDLLQPRSQHFTASEFQRQWPTKFALLPSFAILRDPVDRFISAFNYVSNGGNGGLIDTECARRLNHRTPNWFINTVLSRSIDPSTRQPIPGYWSLCAHNSCDKSHQRSGIPVHFVPQFMFCCDKNGVSKVTALFTMEDVDSGACINRMNAIVKEKGSSGSGAFPLWNTSMHSNKRMRVTKDLLDGENKKIWTKEDFDDQMVARLLEIYQMDVKLIESVLASREN